MTDSELDTLLAAPLPEHDAGDFSVALMERIAHAQARPARILAWVMVAILFVTVAAAAVYGAVLMRQSPTLMIPALLTLLTFALSYAVLQSARE